MKKIHLTENELVELIQKVIKEKYTDSETKEVAEEKKKKDRCHRCADQSYGPETSAYKSGKRWSNVDKVRFGKEKNVDFMKKLHLTEEELVKLIKIVINEKTDYSKEKKVVYMVGLVDKEEKVRVVGG